MTGTMGDMAIDWNKADRAAIGQAVENARLEREWGKEEACRRSGLSPTTWSRIEDGERVQDAKLAAALRVLEIGFTLPGTKPGEVVTIGRQSADARQPTSLEERVIALEEQLARLLTEDDGDQATTA